MFIPLPTRQFWSHEDFAWALYHLYIVLVLARSIITVIQNTWKCSNFAALFSLRKHTSETILKHFSPKNWILVPRCLLFLFHYFEICRKVFEYQFITNYITAVSSYTQKMNKEYKNSILHYFFFFFLYKKLVVTVAAKLQCFGSVIFCRC